MGLISLGFSWEIQYKTHLRAGSHAFQSAPSPTIWTYEGLNNLQDTVHWSGPDETLSPSPSSLTKPLSSHRHLPYSSQSLPAHIPESEPLGHWFRPKQGQRAPKGKACLPQAPAHVLSSGPGAVTLFTCPPGFQVRTPACPKIPSVRLLISSCPWVLGPFFWCLSIFVDHWWYLLGYEPLLTQSCPLGSDASWHSPPPVDSPGFTTHLLLISDTHSRIPSLYLFVFHSLNSQWGKWDTLPCTVMAYKGNQDINLGPTV